MGEGNSNVLVKNEKQANKAVAKVMRITFVMFTLVYFMNVAGIFIVDMKIMTIAYGMAAVLLWLPTLLVNVLKLEQPFVKDPDQTIRAMLKANGDLTVVRFYRFEMGEGLQKRQDNFAEEVMGQMKK